MTKVQVKSFLRNGKVVKSFLRNKKIVVPAVGAATLIGVPTITYAAVRKKYRDNIPKSANMAKAKSLTIGTENVPEDKKQIVITSGGFAGLNGRAGLRIKKGLEQAGLDKNNFIDTINNKEFDIKDSYGKDGSFLKFTLQTNQKMLETTLKTGYNPVSVRMAAKAYAYKRKYPDKDVALVGQSAGGLVASEASEILKQMGVENKLITMGTPNFGYVKDTGNSLHLTSKKDFMSKLPTRKKAKYVNSVDGHQIAKYLNNKDVQKELDKFLSKRTSSSNR